jgi:hypothetical protein
MYGETANEVRANLVNIPWLPRSGGGSVTITKVNGVDSRLAKVSAELDALPPKIKKYVLQPAGTFNWRNISGTGRLSSHSFGIAIDINVKYANYWKWLKGREGEALPYRNRIPMEIVEIFEKHGFIWGGKWYHFDTMHFEYRPELLVELKPDQ